MLFTSLNKDLQYITTSIINNNCVSRSDVIIDTGSAFTLYHANSISSNLKSKDFIESEYIRTYGIVEYNDKDNRLKESILFYKYFVNQFIIGNIDLGSQIVWITFDNRFKDNLLGIDLLSKLTYMQLENDNRLFFFRNRQELLNYILKETSIERVLHKTSKFNEYYIELYNMKCYFNEDIIKYDNNLKRRYILLDKRICYLR